MRTPIPSFAFTLRAMVGVVLTNIAILSSAQSNERPPQASNVAQPERLSNWLLEQTPKDGGQSKLYSIGISWFSPEEVAAQAQRKKILLQTLGQVKVDAPPINQSDAAPTASRGARPTKSPELVAKERLENLIRSLPVTGRITLPNTDPRFLEVNPRLDPILMPGERVTLPPRPTTVTVITPSGRLCKVRHRAGVLAFVYIEACQESPRDTQVDWAWIIEPDGVIQRVPTAAWNAAKQAEPAPGAWIWAPPRGSMWNSHAGQRFSKEWVHFLSTQTLSGEDGGWDQEARRASMNQSLAANAPIERDLPISATLWGGTGLLQTPSARFAPAGTGSISVGWYQPYTNVNFFLNPTDWFEFGFRYTNINNIPYAAYTSQSYKDKSLDFKIKLINENHWRPQIALGARDFVGTGLFSGEYVVASKRYRNLDTSLGIGWGSLGTRNNLGNPLNAISPNMSSRPPPQTGQGGTPGSYYFHGNAALFGGVQYHTPWDKVVLKLEVDGNNYQQQPFGDNIAVRSIFNFGAVYQTKFIDWTIGMMGNKTVMLSINLHERLDQLNAPKLAEPKPVPVQLKSLANYTPTLPVAAPVIATAPAIPSAATSLVSPQPNTTNRSDPSAKPSGTLNPLRADRANPTSAYRATLLALEEQTGWPVKNLRQVGNAWVVTFTDANGFYLRNRLDRGIAVLHRDAPASITRFDLKLDHWGMVVSEYKVDRAQWMLAQTQLLRPSERKADITIEATDRKAPFNQLQVKEGILLGELPSRSPFVQDFGLTYNQLVGGPDTPVLFAVSAKSDAIYKFNESTWISNTLNLRLVDNFGKFQYDGPTNLPPVRTDIRQYMTTSIGTMPNMQITKTDKFGENHFVSAYAGYLEMMFAGVGGEYLYRPSASRFAIGANMNYVKQRQFNQWTSLQAYGVNTGHLTGYWDTGVEDILLKLSAGQYLAGDRGGTLDISKVFQNGVKIGAFATKTNVSSQQFGEGSFDKGIYVSIPFDAFLVKHSDSAANLLWVPLIRDGGQMLFRKYQLYDMTRTRDPRALQTGNASGRIGDSPSGPDSTLAY